MGYALFFARKLSLNTRINSLNAQLMVISNQQNELTERLSAQQIKNNVRSNEANLQAARNYTSALSKDGISDDDRTKAENEYQEALSKNSLLGNMDDVDIMELEGEQSVLDLRRETIETQLNAAQKELESVEKAEENAIKSATPGYVS